MAPAPGKHKEKTYDPTTNVECLLPTWVSRASATQRKGRAGRVQAGVAFHLFPTAQWADMTEYQLPEMLRTPLEQLCLQVRARTAACAHSCGKGQPSATHTYTHILTHPPAADRQAAPV